MKPHISTLETLSALALQGERDRHNGQLFDLPAVLQACQDFNLRYHQARLAYEAGWHKPDSAQTTSEPDNP